MDTEARNIPGFPGYTVTRNGEVLGKRGKILRPHRSTRYGDCVHLYREGKKHARSIGSLVLSAFVGPRPDGMECCHGPKGSFCHELSNLSWGTRADNVADRYRDGSNFRKMTRELLEQIRRLSATGMSQRAVAAKVGVSQAIVGRALKGRYNAHLCV